MSIDIEQLKQQIKTEVKDEIEKEFETKINQKMKKILESQEKSTRYCLCTILLLSILFSLFIQGKLDVALLFLGLLIILGCLALKKSTM